jgi:hypothetical protein
MMPTRRRAALSITLGGFLSMLVNQKSKPELLRQRTEAIQSQSR